MSSVEKGNCLSENPKKFPYPPCWENDTRMDVFMAPFRPRSVNPENYASKLSFWEEMIVKYCEFTGCPSFSKKELQVAFRRKGKHPYALDTVFEKMILQSEIKPKSEFMYDPLNSWMGWAANNFIKKPFVWAASKIQQVDCSDNSSLQYVHLDLVKKFSKELQNVLQKYAGKVLSYEDVKEYLKGKINFNEDGLNICLHVLHCQKDIYVEYIVEKGEKIIHLIKIPNKNEEATSMTDSDRAVHNLEVTQKSLNSQLESIEKDIKRNDEITRQYVKEGKKQLAKSYLRKKHLLLKNYEKRSIALNNIETLLASVEEAQNNGIVLDAYKVGSKTLQKLLSDSGLTLENVDQIAADVKEAVEINDEMQESVANVKLADNFDDDALEKELKEILGESDNVRVPTTEPQKFDTNEVSDKDLLELLETLKVENESPESKKVQKPNVAGNL